MYTIWYRDAYLGSSKIEVEGRAMAQLLWDTIKAAGYEMLCARP